MDITGIRGVGGDNMEMSNDMYWGNCKVCSKRMLIDSNEMELNCAECRRFECNDDNTSNTTREFRCTVCGKWSAVYDKNIRYCAICRRMCNDTIGTHPRRCAKCSEPIRDPDSDLTYCTDCINCRGDK